MIFEDALIDIANRFGFDPDALIQYSYEDEISGWDGGVGDWPVGSLWTVEGRVLYALVRALRPARVVEIGTNVGCSATHIASALKANGTGKLITYDINQRVTIPPDEHGHVPNYAAGELIPTDLAPYVDIMHGDGVQHVELDLTSADLIYEDGEHSAESVQRVWQAGVPKLTPGGIMISHDAAHFLVGEEIQRGIREAGYEPTIYPIRPSDCGLAVWRKPMEDVQPFEDEAEVIIEMDTEPIPLSAFVPSTVSAVPKDMADNPKTFIQLDFDGMTHKQLIAYAKENDITLGSARKKTDIIKKLRGA